MPAMPMDDGGWGQIAAGLADAIAPDPSKRAHMMVYGAQYRKLQQEAEDARLLEEQRKKTMGAYETSYPIRANALPQPSPEGAPFDLGQKLQKTGYNPMSDADYEAKRNLGLQVFNLGARSAKSMNDVAQGAYPLIAQGNLLTTGVPTDPGQLALTQTQLTGKLPEYDEAKRPLTNYVVKDGSGNIVGEGRSRDGLIDLNTGQPIKVPPGGSVLGAGQASLDTKGLGDENVRLSKIKSAVDTIEQMGPGSLSPEKLRETELAIATQWPHAVKYESDARGNKILIGYEDKAIPRVVGKVLAEINSQYASAPPPSSAPAAVPFPALGAGVVPTPDALAGAPAAAPAAPPAGAFAAPPAPIVPAGALPQVAGAPGQVSVTQLPGGGGPATHEAANTARQVELAQQARLKLQEKIGFDERTGQLKPGYYVPGLTATAIGERYGGSATGRAIVKKLDPAAQEYRAEAMRWIEPVLRNASGAAIRPEEYGDYFAMFIPETGDSPQEVTRKLGAMKAWEQATAGAATANQALARMDQIAQQAGDPAMRSAADRIRVIARERGTLDVPLTGGGGGGGAATAAPAGAAVAAPAVDHNAVQARLRSLGLM
jgi:hypothetical protein